MVKLWLFIVKEVSYLVTVQWNTLSSFVAFVIFLTQIWSRTTVLLVSLGFLVPVECNRPAKFLLSSTVTIKSTRNSLKWYQNFTGRHLLPESKKQL